MVTERLQKEHWIKNDFVDISRKCLTGNVEEHWHEFYELELIVRGGGTYTIDGIAYPIRCGNLFLLSPSSFHRITFTEDTEIVNLMFAADVCNADFLCRLFCEEPHSVIRLYGAELNFVQTLLDDMVKNEYVPYLVAALDCLLGKLVLLSAPEPLPIKDAQMQRAILYVQNHFRENVTLAEAARLAHYSPNYFSNRFKTYFGVTFKEYILGLRFSLAEKMLERTGIPVTEICYSCGFADFSNFFAAFKKRYGATPREFRLQSRGGSFSAEEYNSEL